MKTQTIQDLGMVNDVNLCSSCRDEMPSCLSDNIIFGTGKGNDNVAACSNYQAIEYRHPRHNGAGDL